MIDDPFQNAVLLTLMVACFASAVTIAAVARLRYGAPVLLAFAAGVTMYVGVASAGFATAHLVGVIWTAAYVHPVFVWDFRFAGLLLVGLTLLTGGLILMVSALGVGRARRADWRHAAAGTLWLMIVGADLFPIQPELAGGVVSSAGLDLIALVVTRLWFRQSFALRSTPSTS